MRGIASLALVGLLGLLVGCAAPIGIRVADPREVQRYLTRSALTDDEPSDFSLNELRRYALLKEFRSDPDAALARLHEAARAEDFPSPALFALAELSFLRASQTKQQMGYATAVIYAYALLFPEDERARLDDLDPRTRIAADLYNRALTSTFRLKRSGMLELGSGGTFALPIGTLHVTSSPQMLEMNGAELYALRPVAEIEIKGLRNRYRRPGIGAPLAAKMRPLPGVTPVVSMSRLVLVPLTAVARIAFPLAALRTGEFHAEMELYASYDVESTELGGRPVPLEAEPTASLAASLSESQFWKKELRAFLGNAIGLREQTFLTGLRPYKAGRIPVVFVHGTASSPGRWADMVNDLTADARLRARYDFWLFTYDSGNPIVYSGYQLREALLGAVNRADPSGRDPCARDMVVLGHSQGGLLTKLTAIDSGDAFWANISSKPFDDVKLDPTSKEILRRSLFVHPLPFVTEVIFLATPQRGSYLAGPQIVRRLAEYFVRLPSDLVRVSAGVATMATSGGVGLPLSRLPTSIDNMSPGNPFIKTLAALPVSPGVTAHSIIAVDSDAPLEEAGDGVVKYASAHVEGVASELIVRSPHSGMQAAPATIEEVRRILLEHSESSACPPPAP